MHKSLLVFLLIAFCSGATAQRKFVLNGKITGYEDSTRIIINKILANGEADLQNERTLFLLNEQFIFSDDITMPTRYSIRVRPKNMSDLDFTKWEDMPFWAENKPMALTAVKGTVAFADVSGSEMQDAFEEFQNLEKEKKIRNKQITDSVKMYGEFIPTTTMKIMRETFEANDGIIKQASLEYTYSNPQFYFSVVEMAFWLKHYPESVDKKRVVNFYEQLTMAHKEDETGKAIKNYIESTKPFKKLTTRNKPRSFTLPDSSGTRISLTSLKGRVVLLDFWFAGCAPCRAEHKTYLEVYKTYHQKGFEILSVNIDGQKETWTNAMQKDTLIWKSVWDPQKKITTDLYGINSFPSNYLIDAKGVIIAEDLRGEALLTALETIFRKK